MLLVPGISVSTTVSLPFFRKRIACESISRKIPVIQTRSARSTCNEPRAINRHNAARPACRLTGSAASTPPRVGVFPDRVVNSTSSATAGSSGAPLSGNSRLALSSIDPRILRSVAMRNTAPCSRAHSPAATNAGLSRAQLARRSARYFTSTSSACTALCCTRKSGVYRRVLAPSLKFSVTALENGKKNLQLSTLERVCEGLEVAMSEVIQRPNGSDGVV